MRDVVELKRYIFSENTGRNNNLALMVQNQKTMANNQSRLEKNQIRLCENQQVMEDSQQIIAETFTRVEQKINMLSSVDARNMGDLQ